MNNRLLQLQLFYEIAMAIGNDLELDDMLKESIGTYLRKLSFSAGAVMELKRTCDNSCSYTPIFSIPRTLENNKTYQAALARLPQNALDEEILAFLKTMPVVVSADEDHTSYSIVELPEFGVLILLMDNQLTDPQLFRSLGPLNAKLAQSCIACRNNETLKLEIVTRKQSERSLARSEERLRTILNAVHSGIVIIDIQTNLIVEINPKAIHMLDYTREQLIGRPYSQVLFPNLPDNYLVIDNEESIENTEQELQTKDGTVVPVLLNAAVVELNDRKHLLVSFSDLREIKSAEGETKRLEKLLRQSQKMEAIGTLAGGIAHDFNNLLTPILGLTQLCLEETVVDPFVFENLEEISRAGHRAKDLVKQILSFAHQNDEELIPIQPKPVIKETLKLLRASLPTTIEIDTRITSSGSFLGSPTHLQQIIMNLCTNAAFAMKERGGTLSISLHEIDWQEVPEHPNRKEGSYLRFAIGDTGDGIPKEIAESIFEPYFTTKEQNEGTGLGLALVHGLVKSADGFIDFQSEVGKGTTFNLFFPMLREKAEAGEKSQKQLTPGTESILFVDDEPYILNFGTRLFKRLGYKVTATTSSIEALQLFKKNPADFDLVFTDMTMPKMTGDRLADEILKIRPKMPIIIFTGYSDRLTPQQTSRMGIKALLQKPLDTTEIARQVRHVLDESKRVPRVTQNGAIER